MGGTGNLIVKGGQLIDGTGSPARPADVRIRDGLVAEVGPDLTPEGEEQLDADGATVAPGFIDSHTHLDPSMFWDPACDPMPQQGVTTALIGNCSLSLAPVKPEHLEEVMDVFCYIEDMPIEEFRNGIPWSWQTWREYRDAMNERGAALNMASLIGHSMLRIFVMGEDAWQRAATPAEIGAMCDELRDALGAGCFGISTSFFDVDRKGRFVPSRLADQVEFDALAETLGRAGHGLVEFIPNFTGETPLEEMKQIAETLAPHGVTSIWNGLLHTEMAPDRAGELIDYSQSLRDAGSDIWPDCLAADGRFQHQLGADDGLHDAPGRLEPDHVGPGGRAGRDAPGPGLAEGRAGGVGPSGQVALSEHAHRARALHVRDEAREREMAGPEPEAISSTHAEDTRATSSPIGSSRTTSLPASWPWASATATSRAWPGCSSTIGRSSARAMPARTSR